MQPINYVIIIMVFFVSLISCYFIMKRNFSKKILGKDINKLAQNLVAESGGLALPIPLWILFVLISYFYEFNIFLFIIFVAITIFSIVGFVDDNKNKFFAKTVEWKIRALPMAVTSLILSLILFFPQNILEIFWVVIFALFFTGIASFSNTFEGLNGWTIGSSFIITIFASIVAFQISIFLSFLFLSLVAIILGLLLFNKFPAKVFPGDSGTLFIGSTIAGIALFSQNLFFIIFIFLLFIPHMVDFFLLKMITNKEDASQQKMRPYKIITKGKDKGKLTIPDYKGKIRYDFAKMLMKLFGPMEEWKIVSIIWVIVIVNCVLWTLVFTQFVF
jgi:UDP-N-acetylglucosamine--dolichyl-phosphate N-acetylglucosaminephosphotransferase